MVSAEKLGLLRQMCTDLGVYTIPKCIEGVWIVPLYSWYHASFDTEPDVPGALPVQKVVFWSLSDCMSACISCLLHRQLLFADTVSACHINNDCLRSQHAQSKMGTSSAFKVSQCISLLTQQIYKAVRPNTLMLPCSKTSCLAAQPRIATACSSSLSSCA